MFSLYLVGGAGVVIAGLWFMYKRQQAKIKELDKLLERKEDELAASEDLKERIIEMQDVFKVTEANEREAVKKALTEVEENEKLTDRDIISLTDAINGVRDYEKDRGE